VRNARETLIPMAGTVARIIADGELGSRHPAGLDQSLTELFKNSLALYQAGRQAKAAARQVRLSGHRRPRRAPEALHISNAGDVGLESRAAGAELGMALALLMYRSQSVVRTVLASGALGSSDGGQDIPVRAAENLEDKLRTVAQHFSQPGTPPPPRFFLVPQHDPDGEPVRTRYRLEIEALGKLGILVLEARTLNEAARRAGARRYPVHLGQRLLRLLSCGIAAGLSGTLMLHLLYRAPIPLSFGAVASADGTISATPARKPDIPLARVLMLPPCRTAGSGKPGFVIGEWMAIHLRAGAPDDIAAQLVGYQHALVSISSDGRTRVLPTPVPSSLDAHAATAYIEVRAPEEERLLVWLVKRGAPFDTAALAAQLRKALDPLLPAERISAARNLLRAIAPGVLFYSFRTVSMDPCSQQLTFDHEPPMV
jgi:hypothetical protein